MRYEYFEQWLKKQNYKIGPIRDALSRCRRIERDLKIDLDSEYNRNQCSDVIDRLTAGVKAPIGITINGDLKNGLSSLKNAVKKYVIFCSQFMEPQNNSICSTIVQITGSNNVTANLNSSSKVSQDSVRRGHTINCLEGLIELIIGEENTSLSQEKKLKMLASHMIQKSYFFTRESVDKRHQEIITLIKKNEKIPVRYSTMTEIYKEVNGNTVNFSKNTDAFDASTQRRIMYNCFGRSVPVLIDRDGNREVRCNIERYSGARVGQGRVRNNVFSAIISHIWGYAYNPICFTNLWNIVIIPDYVNSILDKSETKSPANFFEEAINYVKAYYKELCYKMYDMESKINDYERLGFNIRPIFSDSAKSNIVDLVKNLNFLENQGF